MNQKDDWEEIKKTYLAGLTSRSKITTTKTVVTHIENFLIDDNLDPQDLPHHITDFKSYLQSKSKSKKSFRTYLWAFNALYGWLEKNYFKKPEPVSKEAKPHKPETPAIERKPAPEPFPTFDIDKWISERNYTCPNCRSLPFKGKDGLWYVICPKPKEWKETRSGRLRPSKGAKGKIPIQVCQSTQAYITKRKLPAIEEKSPTEASEETLDFSRLPKIHEPTIEEIVTQVGVCENPLLARRRHGGLACVLCQKRCPQKWEACQAIQKELKSSQIAFDKFAKSMRQRILDEKEAGKDPYWWWGSPKTEDMTLEEIEEGLGLREPSKPRRISCSKFCSPLKIMDCEKYPSCDLNTGIAPEEELDVFDIAEREAEPLRFARGKTIEPEQPVPQDLFDAIRRRYHEICESCEEHTKHRCSSYCQEFWEGMPEDMKAEAQRLKHYPSESLRMSLRERLKEIVPDSISDEVAKNESYG